MRLTQRTATTWLATAFLLALVPGVQAQAPVDGVLYFTPEKLSEEATTVVGCGVEESYALTHAPPTEEAASKISQIGVFGSSCTVEFEYTVAAPFTLTGPGSATIYLSCDEPTLIRTGSNNGVNNVASARVELEKNGADVSLNNVFLSGADVACSGPTDIVTVTTPVAVGAGAEFVAGDKLSLKTIVWWLNAEPDTLSQGHYLLYGTDRPASFTAPGLPLNNDVAPGGDPDDVDADGLNDTWEQNHFGNLTAQNGTGDPDGDGLNNTQEFAQGTNATNPDTDADGLQDGNETERGTNPLVADTDGDGHSDGDEVANGTDPLNPDDPPADGGDGDGDGGDGGDGDGAGDGDEAGGGDTDTLAENFQEDTGYAIASAAGMGAVLVLSILGLAVRWAA